MRTIETTVYKFEELSPEAQQNAIEGLYDLNVDHEWWSWTYEDAENIGLKITEFDLGRGSYVKGEFIGSAMETAEKIIADHGKHCETWETAQVYMNDRKELFAGQAQIAADDFYLRQEDPGIVFEIGYDEIGTQDIDDDFLHALCEDYRIILSKEYEYLTSEEAIRETIEANEYEFDVEGNMI